ncbi:YbaB/EbfC family nucleoid-associated protein [Actinoallomurus spadix]|uniref:YbaB/EbfC family nucleoid-associated protein n=1 Tax=Actinoallomurus spadix TaxID=79912 RepID=A0ABN0XL24_9ACTN|nr:YbaB/EbfC family nucleoid-associated protein [Actinoallomurus spadix]MCO5985082.1 YbaB/EbfC family nucleoid-associated protein [Actinoallomurus spadix]
MTTSPDPGTNLPPAMAAEMNRLLGEFQSEIEPLMEVRRELSSVRGTGEAADGLVTIEALPTGALSSVKIDPRALRLGADALGEAILQAAQRAAEEANAQLNERMNEAMSPYVGDIERLLGDTT